MENNFNFEIVLELVGNFEITGLSQDLLFEEYSRLKLFLAGTNEKYKALAYDKKLVQFVVYQDCPNLKRICNFTFSLPQSCLLRTCFYFL